MTQFKAHKHRVGVTEVPAIYAPVQAGLQRVQDGLLLDHGYTGVFQNWVYISGVPVQRIVVWRGLCWGPLFWGNRCAHLGRSKIMGS